MVLLLLILIGGIACAILAEQEKGREDVARGHDDCPGCGHAVDAEWLICPHCRSMLRERCTGCGQQRSVFHRYCPQCGEPEQERTA
ncbi:double zinc ribbon domain-containing protein [Trichloromonas sp.]|uniref:double zinc ribbon domain-containing protein n=1 Tax=Trichloromonas sp. TaxID=3069249 RepID=UPI003D8187C5